MTPSLYSEPIHLMAVSMCACVSERVFVCVVSVWQSVHVLHILVFVACIVAHARVVSKMPSTLLKNLAFEV